MPDFVSDDVDVSLALWRLVASSATMAHDAKVVGPAEHPLLLLLPEQDVASPNQLRYMLRIVDAPAAVAARGWRPVSVAVDLELSDRFCDWNVGRWRLVVGEGEGRLERGGAGTVRLGIGAFASLFSGYSSARTLAATGLLHGAGDREIAALDLLFSGPTPWMADFF